MRKSKDSESQFIQGRWNKISIKNKKLFTAKYDKIKDWRMDPLGYFLIGIDEEKNLIRAGYCKITKKNNSPKHKMFAEVSGKTAIEIVNTLIKKGFISSLQHSADMGIELCKAELALKYKLKYIQDKDLKIK
jgi:tetrahydromethanopterin S-methyltransferase subunit A